MRTFPAHHSPLPPHQSLYTRPSSAVPQTNPLVHCRCPEGWALWGSFLYSAMLIINRGYSMNVHGRKDGRKKEGKKREERYCTAFISIHYLV